MRTIEYALTRFMSEQIVMLDPVGYGFLGTSIVKLCEEIIEICCYFHLFTEKCSLNRLFYERHRKMSIR